MTEYGKENVIMSYGEKKRITISVAESTYNRLVEEAKNANTTIEQYITDLIRDDTDIIPTAQEKKEWKECLYNANAFLATERPEFMPRKRDSLDCLLQSFLAWAETYNDGYFTERDDASTDRYCAWLCQEYDREYGYD